MADQNHNKLLSVLLLISSTLKLGQAECLAGQFLDSGSCVDCSAGYFNNATDATSCTDDCPTGTFSLAGAEECTDCPTGFVQFDESSANVDSSSCETGCDAGYSFDGSTCSVCSAGSYTHNTTLADTTSGGCTKCETGFTTDGILPSTACLDCAAGYGGPNCETCESGLTSENLNNPSSNSCTNCDYTKGSDGCSGHGFCDSSTGSCTCDKDWGNPWTTVDGVRVEYAGPTHNVIDQCSQSTNPCDYLTCQNSGVCNRAGDSASCVCDAEFYGDNCESSYDDCDLGLCGTGGSCTDGTRTSSGVYDYTCSCSTGYQLDDSYANEPTCEIVLPCETTVCQNPAGVCTNYDDSGSLVAKCGYEDSTNAGVFNCDTGYEGDLCDQVVDNCLENPCDINGASACNNEVGSFNCTCNLNWRGKTCDQQPQWETTVTVPVNIEIAGLTIGSYGAMSSMEDTMEAACDKQFQNDTKYIAGSFFGYTQTYDASTPGISISYGFKVISYTDPDAVGSSDKKRRRKRRSAAFHLDNFGKYVSHVAMSAADDFSFTVSKSRSRRSLSADELSALTDSLVGIASDPAVAAQLASDAASVGLTASAPTASTPTAVKEVDVDACVDNPCQNGGGCVDGTGTDNTVGGRVCTCVTGFNGTSCETNIDDCAADPCSNDFQCTDGVDNYFCDCSASSKWSGKECSTDTFCAATDPCSTNGACSNATCSCDTVAAAASVQTYNWDGPTCSYKDFCAALTCPGNSTCEGTQTSGNCICDTGYSPAYPAANACQVFACDGYCKNSGTCNFNSTTATPECTCSGDYFGATCEKTVCDGYNCNDGTCEVDHYDSTVAVCACNTGFSGDFCENDACHENLCEYGDCVIASNKTEYTCDCVDGYEGSMCGTLITTTTQEVNTTQSVETTAIVETTPVAQTCPTTTIGSLIQADGTIRPSHDPSYCLVHYGTTRRSPFKWHKCDEAKNNSAFMQFEFEANESSDDFGVIRTVQHGKCMYIKTPSKFRRNPVVLMRHCSKEHHYKEKLQWEIKDNALNFKLGEGNYCVPFEAGKQARLRRCRWMTLG